MDSLLSHEALTRIDEAADQFEAAWKDGRSPLLEEHLGEIPEPERSALFRALLEVELHYRRQRGDSPTAPEYESRFPQHAELVRNVLVATETSTPGERPALAAANIAAEGLAHYSLRGVFAEGGLGRVWTAWDSRLNREVALKEIQPSQASQPDAWQRFLKEAQVTGQLEHPNIVPVYELSRAASDKPFYTMRLVKGRTLRQAIAEYHRHRREGGLDPLELPRLLSAFISTCNAVAYAHSRGVVHRDLKPHNVVLGDFGEVLLLDWGLAKLVGGEDDGSGAPPVSVSDEPHAEATTAGAVMGTPAYMAPEQAEGRLDLVDARTDVYGLGAILFEVLTGTAPHQGSTSKEIIERIIQGDTPRAGVVATAVPPALEAVTAKAMAKDRSRRYAAAAELGQDVQRWLADEPIAAFRDTLLARLARWGRRHKPLVTAAAAALVLLAVALAINNVSIRREQRKTLQAQEDRALDQAKALLRAEPEAVPAIIRGLAPFREVVLPWLREKHQEPDLTPKERRYLSLALLSEDPEQGEYLYEQLLTAEPAEVLLIREFLWPHRDQYQERLWSLANDRQADADRRFRAACALATFDPDGTSDRWVQAGDDVAAKLVRENPLLLKQWIEGLRPVRDALLPRLCDLCREYDLELVRHHAARVLADYAQDKPERLAELILDADETQFALLFPKLQANRDKTVMLLKNALLDHGSNTPLSPNRKDLSLDPSWAAPPPELVRKIESAAGMVHERFALCQTMPLAEFLPLAEALRASGSGYRPVCFRPYVASGTVEVAVIWKRDGQAWQLAYDKSGDEIRHLDRQWRAKGLVPVDVAGYVVENSPEPPVDRYAVVWGVADSEAETTEMYVGIVDDADSQAQGLARASLIPRTLFELSLGKRQRQSGLWVKPKSVPRDPFFDIALGPLIYESQLSRSNFQVDVRIARALTKEQVARRELDRSDEELSINPDDPVARIKRYDANAALGHYEEAIKDVSLLIERVDMAPMGQQRQVDLPVTGIKFYVPPQPAQLYELRARAYAAAGKHAEARTDLVEFQDRLGDPRALQGWKEGVEAIVAAHSDEEAEPIERLEAFVANRSEDPAVLFTAAVAYSAVSAGLPKAQTLKAKRYATRAVELLGRAVQRGILSEAWAVEALQGRVDLDAIRAHPRFLELLPSERFRQVSLSACWHESQDFVSEQAYGLSPEEHLERCQRWTAQQFRPAALSVTAITPDKRITASVWHQRVVPEEEKDTLARRRANAAVALVRLGQPETVWSLLKRQSTDDPRLRSYIIHRLSPLGADPRVVARRLEIEEDVSIRRALVVSLGEFPVDAADVPPALYGDGDWRPSSLVPQLLDLYERDSDAGIHSAVAWLLKKWNYQQHLKKLDAESASEVPRRDRQWYVTSEGHTLAVVRGGVEFDMGSPGHEEGRHPPTERLQRVRIPRSFAIATKEVTVAQFRRFLLAQPDTKAVYLAREGFSASAPDAPVTWVRWYDAIAYCNWLSKQEGKHDQACYPASLEAPPPGNALLRTGYRLPTVAEWEYAARAGATTSRFYGNDEDLMDKYVHRLRPRTPLRTLPVASLKPNDLGLFDVLGNASEWCHNGTATNLVWFPAYPDTRVSRVPGRGAALDADLPPRHNSRGVRGGSFEESVRQLRCAASSSNSVDMQLLVGGFRVARTLDERGDDQPSEGESEKTHMMK